MWRDTYAPPTSEMPCRARRDLGAGRASLRLERARMLREASWRRLEGQTEVSQLGKKEQLLKFFFLQAINSSIQTGLIKKGNISVHVPIGFRHSCVQSLVQIVFVMILFSNTF